MGHGRERDFSPAGLCNWTARRGGAQRGTEDLEARGKVASLRDRKNFTLLVLGVCGGRWQEGLAEKGDHSKSRHVLLGPVKESGCIQRSGKPLRR